MMVGALKATQVYNEYTCMTDDFQNIPYQGFAILRKKHPWTGIWCSFAAKLFPPPQDFVWK